MAFETNELSGALFENEKTNDRQPDFTGNCKMEGTHYWVSAWVKETNAGADFLSLAFTKKDAAKPKSRGRKTGGFLKKARGNRDAKKEAQEVSQTKYQREMEEYQKMTGQQKIDDAFDEEIPFMRPYFGIELIV